MPKKETLEYRNLVGAVEDARTVQMRVFIQNNGSGWLVDITKESALELLSKIESNNGFKPREDNPESHKVSRYGFSTRNNLVLGK